MHVLVDVKVRSVLLVSEGSSTVGACCVPRRRIVVIADHGHCGDTECLAAVVQVARMLLYLLRVVVLDFLSPKS